jgi:hypothetical protein
MNSGRLLCAAAFGLLAFVTESLAQQQVPTPSDQPARINDYVFPAEFEGARRLSVREYEKEHPGLGYSVGYERGGVTATIYIYDAGRKAIPDNPDDAVIMAELRSSTIEAMQFRKNAEMKKGFALVDDQKRRRLVCVLITDYGNSDGTVCVGGAKNKFIKFRTTAPAKPDAPAEAVAFIRPWIKFFWPSS